MGAVYKFKQPIAQQQTERPILYSFRRCPFAMRSRLALAASGQVCELREVVLRDKPQAMLDASPKGTVPVLIDAEGQVWDESLDIMLWALERNDPGGWLAPERGSMDDMLVSIAQFDGGFKHHLDRYKYAARYEGADARVHRAEGARYLEQLDAQLGQMPYLFGNRAALADMAIAPFVRQFAIADSDWFDMQPWPHLQTWLTSWLNSDLYARVMQKYPRWIAGTPGIIFPDPL
ncbi:glutathione S-transferase [Altericista sp. CCNU0014]|uniref:glutathione S-transferase n=1 Tax=Altericista sp. CCNU0014 TaxID=3082949 RepID=UPI00384BE110